MNAMIDTNGISLRPAVRRRSALLFFAVTFCISWAGALALVAPRLLAHQPIPKFTGLMMFPIMLLGPAVAGIALTAQSQGWEGLRALARRMSPLRIPPRWTTVLLIPPVLMLAVLGGFTLFVSARFTPNHFFVGLGFGIVAGLVEEIGWTGYAFPALAQPRGALSAAVILGLLWSLWHAPVVDYLGTATPHGRYWLPYFLAFMAVMTAMRVLICWTYVHTQSVSLAQLLHAASTGALVVFSPQVSAGDETLWYFAYAAVLWCVVAAVVRLDRPAFLRVSE
ncbi:MAG: CPBP family intramembrane glutamic endopeptidase [Acidobacteriota bacterium]